MSERDVQQDILRVFGTRADMRLWRANVGVGSYRDPRTGKMRKVRFGVVGQADLSGILPGGIRLEIETKSADGTQSAEQCAFQRMIERFRGVYVLARSVQDVWAAISPYLNSVPKSDVM